MFAAVFCCAAILAADEPAGVQVKLLVRAKDEGSEVPVEPWIVMGVTKSSDQIALPLTGWVTLTESDARVHSSNGFFVTGIVTKQGGKYEVTIDGCNGGPLYVKTKLTPGERGVFCLAEGSDLFVALQALKTK